MNQIVGNVVPVQIGRKTYFVSYVSIGEWQTFADILENSSNHDLDTLVYLITCSMQRADVLVSKKKVRRLIAKHTKDIFHLVDVICKISLPKVKTPDDKLKETTVDKKEVERNTKILFRVLSRMHGWAPQTISQMSPAQVYIYMTGGTTGTGMEKMSGIEYQTMRASRNLGP